MTLADRSAQLALSRARIRVALMPPPPAPREPLPVSKPIDVLARLEHLPVVGVIVQTTRAWWFTNPWRHVVALAADVSGVAAQPLARRHPYGLVVTAAVVGAIFMRSRPWRWMPRLALFSGLLPRLVGSAVSKMPIETWLTMLSSAPAKAAPIVTRRSRV